jgi:hypothetical protein
MSHSTEPWRTIRWLALLAALLAIAGLAYLGLRQSVLGTASGMERGLDKVLGALTSSDTRIVEGRAEVVSQQEITELSLLELRMAATRRFENEGFVLKYLPTGTKRLIIRGEYRITAGYRLEPGVSLRVDQDTLVAAFPEPSILGVELIDFEVMSERDGWWNEVTAGDRARLLRELRQQMRVEARNSGALDLVDANLETRLRQLIGSQKVRIERPDADSMD